MGGGGHCGARRVLRWCSPNYIDVVRPEDIEEIHTLVPQLVHSHVSDAGHMIPWDDETGFYRAFGEFLGAALPVLIAARG